MTIITNKEFQEIVAFGTLEKIWTNGYPVLVTNNGFSCAYPTCLYEYYEVDKLPNDFELYKYCYTEEKGFYDNPNWKEPEPTEQMYTLDEAAAILASEVNE